MEWSRIREKPREVQNLENMASEVLDAYLMCWRVDVQVPAAGSRGSVG
jgi:hypothetical protein